jgi:hypothetical protein
LPEARERRAGPIVHTAAEVVDRVLHLRLFREERRIDARHAAHHGRQIVAHRRTAVAERARDEEFHAARTAARIVGAELER